MKWREEVLTFTQLRLQGLLTIVQSASRMHINLLKESYQNTTDRVLGGDTHKLVELGLGVGDHAEVCVCCVCCM